VPLPLTEGFQASARLAGGLAIRPEVAARWSDESACDGMTVGGLANHLVAQADIAVRLLGGAPSELAPVPLLEHYRRAAWVHTDLDEEANTTVRDSANAEADAGFAGLERRVADGLAALPPTLAAADGREPDSWLIPWQGWALTAHDLMVTRLMEMMVHSDDLAASVDVETPQFPDDVVAAVLALLSGVAVERHGQTAVLRALSRPQRAPAHVSAFGG
jgi:Mycothiol maleylpyruvate isomerase N-terminal domain